ncbi:MAG: hypothetical protein ABIQ66_10700 [Novosphingobium sp.]
MPKAAVRIGGRQRQLSSTYCLSPAAAAAGYDASPRDTVRSRHAAGCEDVRFDYRYPLREWHWDRRRCEQRIAEAGLPIPVKSSCYFCGAIKPDEVVLLSREELRTIVLMEARAKPRLRNIDGLWRKPVLGRRGATPRPGSITAFIREAGLLPAGEVDEIVNSAPTALIAFQEAQAALPLAERRTMGHWLADFHRAQGAIAGRLAG